MAHFKLEIQVIAGEQIPTIIAECLKCGGSIAVHERDFLFSRPLQCTSCNHQRNLTYREYVVIYDSLAHQLLAHSSSRYDKNCYHRRH